MEGNIMKIKIFWSLLVIPVFLVLVFNTTACSKEEPDEEIIFTRQAPGSWAGKEEGHIPKIAWEKTENGLKVTINVHHEMNSEKPHYIMWVKLQDGKNNLLGEKEFQSSDKKAQAIFELTEIPSKLKAYEKCNLHGTWMEEIEIN